MRVMVIEDSKILADAIKALLIDMDDVNIEGEATTAQAAILQLNTQQFDLIIVDIELAQGTGFEVMEYINHPGYAYKTPISIMLTNHAYSVYREQALRLGVDYFFDKSMQIEDAIAAIEREVSLH